MPNFVKIGELCVNLYRCSFAKSDLGSEGPKIKIFFGSADEYYSFSLKSHPKEYHALERFLNAQETLESYNLRQIRDEAFNPFLDEMPTTLYALFCSLPNADKLHLVLTHTSEGRIENAGQEVLHWDDFDEALEMLQAYKRDYVAPPTPEPFDPYLDESELP